MAQHRIHHINGNINITSMLLVIFIAELSIVPSLSAVELPPELPLWDKPPQDYSVGHNVKEQLQSYKPRSGSPSESNRVFSSVSSPTYSIHRPKNPNGVGLVICPGGGFRNVWIDREGHDLALWLKDHNVTSLVLKYRTFVASDKNPENTWQKYQRIVQADGRQAIRILRKKASSLKLQPDKIGICGFSAGGHLAISCALRTESKLMGTEVSGMPDFAGLFYPGIPDNVGQIIDSRTASADDASGICPMFVMNARVDKLTPADKCVEFYSMLLRAGVNAELHVFGKGSHGFDLGDGRGKSLAMWPRSFTSWLSDSNMIQD